MESGPALFQLLGPMLLLPCAETPGHSLLNLMKNRSSNMPLIARSAGMVCLALFLLGGARAQSNFDWKQASGTKLVVMLNKLRKYGISDARPFKSILRTTPSEGGRNGAAEEIGMQLVLWR